MSDSGISHPHVREGQLCAGDGQPAMRAALASGRILDFFTLVTRVLATYNAASAYVPLDRWSGVACEDCGHVVPSDDCCACERCDDTLCTHCGSPCSRCGYQVCSRCLDQCSGCGDTFCRRCLTRENHSSLRHCHQCREERLAADGPPADASPSDPLSVEHQAHATSLEIAADGAAA